jgi:hypothetical protein
VLFAEDARDLRCARALDGAAAYTLWLGSRRSDQVRPFIELDATLAEWGEWSPWEVLGENVHSSSRFCFDDSSVERITSTEALTLGRQKPARVDLRRHPRRWLRRGVQRGRGGSGALGIEPEEHWESAAERAVRVVAEDMVRELEDQG